MCMLTCVLSASAVLVSWLFSVAHLFVLHSFVHAAVLCLQNPCHVFSKCVSSTDVLFCDVDREYRAASSSN
jgi:hypothetical protein